jgi:hypothetical protein
LRVNPGLNQKTAKAAKPLDVLLNRPRFDRAMVVIEEGGRAAALEIRRNFLL